MKVKLMLDNVRYKDKPNGYETGGIQKRISPREVTIEELAIALCNGQTCKPALLIGRKSADWIEQQVFMLDFDHDTTITTQLNIANDLGINPVFLYTSFTHTEDNPRFRMVFINEYIITDVEKRNKLQSTLIRLFDKSDKVTFDPTRIFYGGKGLYPIAPNYENRINIDEILDKYYVEESTTKKVVNKQKFDKILNKKIPENYLLNLSKIDAIKSLNASKYKACRDLNLPLLAKDSLLSSRGKFDIVKSEKELYKKFKEIDLYDFLGIKNQDARFSCFLPNHKHDTDPSAHIYITSDGTPIYKCFGCDHALQIVSLVETLADTTNLNAIEFLMEIYDIKLIPSEWTIKQKKSIKHNIFYLNNDPFIVEFPYLSKLIRTRKPHLTSLLTYFETLVDEESQLNGKALFFSSYNKLMEVCGVNPNRYITMSQTLTLFTLLNMIQKIEPETLPSDDLKKAKAISAKYGFKKLTNFYQTEEYGYIQMIKSEEIAKVLVQNNMSLTGLSREYILRTFGVELADKVYPQYKFENKNIGTSKKSDNDSLKIAKKMLKKIEKQGYILEKDIKVSKKIETQWKRSIQEIFDTYGLIRVRANKENKTKYNIPDSIVSQAFVICKERD